MGTRWREIVVQNARTSIGSQTIPLVDHADETPVGVFAFVCPASTGALADYNVCFGIGAIRGGTIVQASVAGNSDDARAAGVARRAIARELININHANAQENGEASITAFGAGSMTLNWDQAAADAYKIVYVFWGGEGVDANIVEFAQPGSPQIQDITGFGFDPVEGEAFGILISAQITFLNGAADHLSADLGVFTSATEQGCVTVVSEHGATTTDTYRICRSGDRCNAAVGLTGSASIQYEATFDSWIDDGFRLEWLDADATNDLDYAVLVVSGGGAAKVVAETITNTGTTHTTSGLGFRPDFVFRFGHGTTESTETSETDLQVQNDNELIMGVSDGVVAHAFWAGDKDGIPDTQANQHYDDTKAYLSAAFDTGAADGSLGLPVWAGGGAAYPKTAPAADEFTIALYLEAFGATSSKRYIGDTVASAPPTAKGGLGPGNPIL